ncbi:MAG: FkbM family methyltransferase [Acetobacteraceae bacterium]|nr:FkbM family methyltransferase [Acetobacteraceae bacterium]
MRGGEMAGLEDALARQLVTALFKSLLLREPDPPSLEAFCDLLRDGKMDVEGLVAAITGSVEFPSALPRLLPQDNDARTFFGDHSQHGEVSFLIRQMVNEASLGRFVVDVGARGVERSNSFDLLRVFGWRGLLVEANPSLIDGIRQGFAGLAMTLVNCAVSDYEGEARFFLGINADVSSLSRDVAEGWGSTTGEISVPVRRLPTILAEHGVPHAFDLLSLDIEGEDFKVMNDLIANSPFRPRWALIEAPPSDGRRVEDFPFVAAVAEAYQMVDRVGPNLVLRCR